MYSKVICYELFLIVLILFADPFEYFIYVFSSVLVGNRAEQNTYLFGWQNVTESVYTNLLEDFLQFFLPTNGRAVPPIPDDLPPRASINYMHSHMSPRYELFEFIFYYFRVVIYDR